MQTNGVHITWLGHATFKIVTTGGKVVLIDPWVTSNPLCPAELKTFEKVDLMLVSHGHFDHIADDSHSGAYVGCQTCDPYALWNIPYPDRHSRSFNLGFAIARVA